MTMTLPDTKLLMDELAGVATELVEALAEVDRIREKRHELFRQLDKAGFSTRDIAAIGGCTHSTVATALAGGKAAVREHRARRGY